MSEASAVRRINGAFLGIGVLWTTYAVFIGLGISILLWGWTLLVVGYFLWRLLRAVQRLAAATEAIADNQYTAVDNG